MSDPLVCHVAENDELLAAYRNVHEVWGGDLALEEYLRWRLGSLQHRRARWYVGCLKRQVVTSLGCYPLEFRIAGRIVAGIAIGAVHTRPEFRRRGYAGELMAYAEDDQLARGAVVSLLYSDIDPDYYARMGYRLCPAWQGDIALGPGEPAAGSPSLEPIERDDRDRLLPILSERYDSAHAGLAISIHRDRQYWDYLLQKDPSDRFYGWPGSGEGLLGYVRLRLVDRHAFIQDVALDVAIPPEDDSFWRAVRQTAAVAGADHIGGWLPDTPGGRRYFGLAPRRSQLPMLKSLDQRLAIGDEFLTAAGHFHEIDHV